MLAAVTVLTGALLVSSASAGSKARIVRLSDVQGSVQMDRGTGDGFDKTFLNMPVVEGSRLKTGDDGRAEVEFEDGSALRVVPNSEVEFTRLSLGDDGQKLSTVQLVAGLAYVNYRGKSADQFTLNFGHESVTLSEAAHFRIGLRNNEATLAVIKGRYRFRLLVKSLRNVDLSDYLREWLAAAPKTKGNLKLEVDVDPQSFL